MTSLIAWQSWDQERFAALHLATDSRISWGSAIHRWDAGRKVFTSSTTADVWAYCGDVLFPALVLSQLMSAVDKGVLFDREATPLERHTVMVESLKASFDRRHSAPDKSFTVLHASREGEGKKARPKLWRTAFDEHQKTWSDEEFAMIEGPGVITVGGTGLTTLKTEVLRWKESSIGGTSRSIYGAFCDAIAKGLDPFSGGAPQIASLYPKGNGITAGTYHDGQLYLHGLPLAASANTDAVEWFDQLFQRMDPKTGAVRLGAARHARPKMK